MPDQVQCPNCGGYKTDEHSEFVNPKTGKPDLTSGGYCILMLLWLIIYVGLIFVLLLVFRADERNTPGCLISLVMVMIFIWFHIKYVRVGKDAQKFYKYECRICGYHWQWREGQPRPTINVRGDLIEKGEQRLERQHRKE